MIVAVHQPQYLPWLGYFDKIRCADAFCVLDNVQYKKNDWQNRNRIKTAGGRQWLTVPVHYRFGQVISSVRINSSVNWRHKHLQALVSNYSRAPFFKDYIEIFEQAYTRDWDLLSELNIFFIEKLRAALALPPIPIVRASQLALSDDPTDRLIDICRALNADTYLSGQDGIKYMDLERFRQNDVQVIIQDFNHPVYPQLFGSFQSHLSVVDLLFNCGVDSLRRIREVNLP